MSKIKSVINGWVSFFKGDYTPEQWSRAMICKCCPEAVVGTYEKFMPDESLREIQGLKCNICKCPLSTKLRSEKEVCPLKKW